MKNLVMIPTYNRKENKPEGLVEILKTCEYIDFVMGFRYITGGPMVNWSLGYVFEDRQLGQSKMSSKTGIETFSRIWKIHLNYLYGINRELV